MGRRRAELVRPIEKESTEQPQGRLSRETARLLPIVLPVVCLGAGVVVVAASAFVAASPNLSRCWQANSSQPGNG